MIRCNKPAQYYYRNGFRACNTCVADLWTPDNETPIASEDIGPCDNPAETYSEFWDRSGFPERAAKHRAAGR